MGTSYMRRAKDCGHPFIGCAACAGDVVCQYDGPTSLSHWKGAV